MRRIMRAIQDFRQQRNFVFMYVCIHRISSDRTWAVFTEFFAVFFCPSRQMLIKLGHISLFFYPFQLIICSHSEFDVYVTVHH